MAEEVKKSFVAKVLDGLTDGATSIVSHGSAEAASALFTGNGYVMYGNHLSSLEGGGDGLSSMEPRPEQDKSNGIER